MYRRALLVTLLAVVASCAPTALPGPDSASPSPAPSALATSDVITLREGGADSYLAVRKVSTAELIRQLPDGVLLPDGTTLIVVETAVSTTTVRAVDRRTGAMLRTRTLAGTWMLRANGPALAGTLSPNGAFLVLVGSSYEFTDSSGAWTAKTTLAVMDTAFARSPEVIELAGRYMLDAIANDGRSLYVWESAPPQLPTSSRLRVLDVGTRGFATLAGDEVPDPSAFRLLPVSAGAFTFEMFAGRPPIIARHDLTGRTTRVLKLAGEQGALGEQVLMWSLVGTPDGRTLYAVNPAIGVIDEIDVASLELRRTAALMASRPRGFLDAVAMALHPVAYAKRGVTNGAVLSPDGSTLYAIGETGVWSVETRSLKGRLLTKEGTYATIVLSPDGMRIYAIGFDDGVVRVVSARDGSSLGAMTRYAWPSNIVAVDVSP